MYAKVDDMIYLLKPTKVFNSPYKLRFQKKHCTRFILMLYLDIKIHKRSFGDKGISGGQPMHYRSRWSRLCLFLVI